MMHCMNCNFAEWQRTPKLKKIKKLAYGKCMYHKKLPDLPAMQKYTEKPVRKVFMYYSEECFEDWEGCLFFEPIDGWKYAKKK